MWATCRRAAEVGARIVSEWRHYIVQLAGRCEHGPQAGKRSPEPAPSGRNLILHGYRPVAVLSRAWGHVDVSMSASSNQSRPRIVVHP